MKFLKSFGGAMAPPLLSAAPPLLVGLYSYKATKPYHESSITTSLVQLVIHWFNLSLLIN